MTEKSRDRARGDRSSEHTYCWNPGLGPRREKGLLMSKPVRAGESLHSHKRHRAQADSLVWVAVFCLHEVLEREKGGENTATEGSLCGLSDSPPGLKPF